MELYVTEGWAWPFERAPRGGVYDPAADSWCEMACRMLEGWTGSCAFVTTLKMIYTVSATAATTLGIENEVV
jgi:hypothetical protein